MQADQLGKLNIWIIFFVTGALAVGMCAGPSGFGMLAEEKLLPVLTGVGDYGRVMLSYTFGVIMNFLMMSLGAQSAFEILIGNMCYGAGLDSVSAMMSFQIGVGDVPISLRGGHGVVLLWSQLYGNKIYH